jgi:uncharacterized protein YodC (DUF2158 family)
MADAQIKPGDVVVLKSGGPPMTVQGIGPLSQMLVGAGVPQSQQIATCMFFSGAGQRVTESFALHMLRLRDQNDPSWWKIVNPNPYPTGMGSGVDDKG